MQQQLANAGVQVHLSRNNDNALGPCVDQRAEMANSLRPNCVVSVHADGGIALDQTGFPDAMGERVYYQPVERGLEIKLKEKLDTLRAARTQARSGQQAGKKGRCARKKGHGSIGAYLLTG